MAYILNTKAVKLRYVTMLIILLSLASAKHLDAQNMGGTYELGKNYLKDKNYKSAINTFHRILHFSEDTLLSLTHFQLGKCYHQLKNYQKATHHFKKALSHSKEDTLGKQIKLALIKTNLKQKNFKAAIHQLHDLSSLPTPSLKNKKFFYAGIAYFGVKNYDQSLRYFQATLPDTAHYAQQQIKKVFNKGKRMRRLNPKTAQILSMVVPGLGQIYVGHIKEGINSLLLNATIVSLAIHTAYKITVLDAFLGYTPWFLRYYQGGYKNAKHLAQHRNNKKLKNLYNQILSIIQNTKAPSALSP